ncbi:MAG: molecular chaperone DnaJ [Actinobacteria bacterium]|nr:molecular chaperone DnaJ [Actinomycetota bacterium]
MARDHYEALGVPREANPDEIKRAYRRLARELHPDANHGDASAEERFKEVTHAYEVLSDPEKRSRYDRFGDDRATGGGGFSDFGSVSDIFSTFFGGMGGQTSRGSNRGADILAEVELSLEEAAEGAEREVELETLAECETCAGSGAASGTFPSQCGACGGSGELREVRRTVFGNMMTASPCARCSGTGREVLDPCESCSGGGRVRVVSSITVQVPPGVDDGARLRITGRGQAGVRGGGTGDLYVQIGVEPHPIFRRAGEDLACEVPVPMTVAALGGVVAIPTLTEDEEVDIAPGTQSGELIRLRGRGMPRLGGRGRGELVAVLRVETPTALDREQTELLERLAKARDETTGQRGLLGKIKEAFS